MDSCNTSGIAGVGNYGFSGVENYGFSRVENYEFSGSSSGFSVVHDPGFSVVHDPGFSGVDVNHGSAGFGGVLMNNNVYEVVETFKPTDVELLAGYLYNKIHSNENEKETFPDLEIYGKQGIEPWEIWKIYEVIKFPYQDYLYFFTHLKKLGGVKPKYDKKSGVRPRWSRTVGSGGTWSETEPGKLIKIDNNPLLCGRLRKFRYENKDKNNVQHGEWLMDEYTFKSTSSDLALCRMKKNNGERGRKRKNVNDSAEEEIDARVTKSLRLQNMEFPNSDGSQFDEPQPYLSEETSEAARVCYEYTESTSENDQLEELKLLQEVLDIPPLQVLESEEADHNELHHQYNHQFDPGKQQSSSMDVGPLVQQQIAPVDDQIRRSQEVTLHSFFNIEELETELQMSEDEMRMYFEGYGFISLGEASTADNPSHEL